MSPEFVKAMHSLLDGELSTEAQKVLNERLRYDPAAMDAYCCQMRMHALLTWRAGAATSEATAKIVAFPVRLRFLRWAQWAVAALFILGALVVALAPSRATAAVDRLFAAMQRGDRSYTISVIEGDARMAMKNGRTLTYEGGVLHLRGDRQFVLVRPIIEGGSRITGSDGKTNWDIVCDGPVKVTRDLTRFRGGLPGEQQESLFLDLTENIACLKSGYDLALGDVLGEPSHVRLYAKKKSRVVRGPREIDIIFRRDSGIIVSLELRGLPRAKGGPEALRLKLISESALPADYFTHTPHHDVDQRIQDESPAPGST